MEETNYSDAIRFGFEYLLENYSDVFIIGQGLWSPWYVGNTMKDLDQRFGKHRVIDTPVSEAACTGAAIGASLCGMSPIVVHPRMDFMLYAMDPIINQAAKWSHMFGAQASPSVTIRAIINRGGEQGAQHSQALHSWFAHVPGLRVVMPSTVADARDLLIASVLCSDPVLFIDDRWLYEQKAVLGSISELNLLEEGPLSIHGGQDITVVGAGHGAFLSKLAAERLNYEGVSVEVIDVRILNPFDEKDLIRSVKKTRRLLVVDIGWSSCGFSAELVAKVAENLGPNTLLSSPKRLTLPDAPAPSSPALEKDYYLTVDKVCDAIKIILNDD